MHVNNNAVSKGLVTKACINHVEVQNFKVLFIEFPVAGKKSERYIIGYLITLGM